MMFAILRHGNKIKTKAALRALAQHNSRDKIFSGNIDSTRTAQNRLLVGTGDAVWDAECLLECYDIKLRSNSVLAREVLLTASPSFFRRTDGSINSDQVERWAATSMTWAQEQWSGGRIASAVLHMDESTPHIHLVVVPLADKVRRARTPRSKDPARQRKPRPDHEVVVLDHDLVFGHKPHFIERQTSYAAAMEPLGLVRGERGSDRRHVPVRKLYGELEEAAKKRVEAAVAADLERLAAVRQREEADELLRKASLFLQTCRLLADRVTPQQRQSMEVMAKELAKLKKISSGVVLR